MQYFVELSPLAGLPRCLRWSSCPQRRRPGFNPWVGKIPWRRKWQPPAVFLPGKSHGQRSLVDYRLQRGGLDLVTEHSTDINPNLLIYPPLLLSPSTTVSLFSMSIGLFYKSVQFSSVTQSCPTLCDPMNRSTPGLPVHHQLLEFTQIHIHRVSDAIQPSHPLSSPSPPAPNPSQLQSLFQ